MNQKREQYGSPSQDEDSINSQELLQEVEQKISKLADLNQVVTDYRKQIRNPIIEDQFDKSEKIEYLQFKEQTMVKRLLELRDDYKQFLSELEAYQQKLVLAVHDMISRAQTQSKQIYQDQENLIRATLSDIQQTKVKIEKFNVINSSPIRQKAHEFQLIKANLQELLNLLVNQDLLKSIETNRCDVDLDSTKKKGNTLRMSNIFKQAQSSGKKQYTASKSPLKELDMYLQLQKGSESKTLKTQQTPDLDSFINTLRHKIAAQPRMMGTQYQRSLDNIWPSKPRVSQVVSVRRPNFMATQPISLAQLSIEEALCKQSYKFLKYRG